MKDERSALILDNGRMVEILNENFTSVFTVENTESMPDSPIAPWGLEPLDIGSIDEGDVRKYLDKLETNKPTNRVVRHWNNLPAEVVTVETITSLKNRIDRHFSASDVN